MDIKELKQRYNEHKHEIKIKINEFSTKKPRDYFHELIFCLLTPQSKAEKCWLAVEELRKGSFSEDKISNCLRNKTRFYKNKTKYLIEAGKNWKKIEKTIYGEKNPISLRRYILTKQTKIKGLGMKEASHFLRNIGKSHNQLAILDRHILRKLKGLKIINKIPNLSEKNYIKIENSMKKFSKKVKIPLDELDLLFWKLESGRIFK